ncbi:TPA: hypothetical protein ACRFJD_002220, partial [Elizabethkingia anophelis]
MKSREFIKKKLEDLTSIYSNSIVKYYYDKFDNDHFICICPISSLQEITDRYSMEIDLEFIEKYPEESLSFIELDENLEFDELIFSYIPESKINSKTINVFQPEMEKDNMSIFKTGREISYKNLVVFTSKS